MQSKTLRTAWVIFYEFREVIYAYLIYKSLINVPETKITIPVGDEYMNIYLSLILSLVPLCIHILISFYCTIKGVHKVKDNVKLYLKKYAIITNLIYWPSVLYLLYLNFVTPVLVNGLYLIVLFLFVLEYLVIFRTKMYV